MNPYLASGQFAAQDLWGMRPVYGGRTGLTSGGTGEAIYDRNTTSVPYLQNTGTGWKDKQRIGYQTYQRTGQGFDRTGGAGEYKSQLADLAQGFKFDANDPAYKYKTEEAQKSIDKALAARGLYDSRAGVNMLTESGRAITADEYEKQYGRKRSELTDLFNMASKLGETKYQGLLDAVKIGTGAGATAGGLGNQATGNLMSAYGNMGAQGNLEQARNQQFWSGLGAMPMNAMLLYNMFKGTGGSQTSPSAWTYNVSE
jgi:hypothetical protein